MEPPTKNHRTTQPRKGHKHSLFAAEACPTGAAEAPTFFKQNREPGYQPLTHVDHI